ncbi:MAG: glycosyltransferase family 87 protein [Bacteroidota bacterium]
MKQALTRLIYNKPFVYSLWFGVCLLLALKGVLTHQPINNYLIFKHNFLNTISQQNLYVQQPEFYFDRNHYGPVFALIFAPFALLPDSVGIILWVAFSALVLFKAIQMLPLDGHKYLVILLLCANDLVGSTLYFQSNPLITALIILSFIFIKRKQDFWAALMIALGTFTKLYGIVGLAFFFFSDNKLKFIASFIFWSAVLFVLPMAISSPSFIIRTYHDWFYDLIAKNAENEGSKMQDYCVMGMVRRLFYPALNNLYVIVPALVIFGLSYLRVKYYRSTQYQLLILASVLIFTVIFSSSAESATYIIAFAGVSIWYMNLDKPTGLDVFLLVFAIIITSFAASDLFPKTLNRVYIQPYRLKVLPVFLIWLKIIYETLTRNFAEGMLTEKAA